MLYCRNHQHCGNPFSFYFTIIFVHIIIIVDIIIIIIDVIVIIAVIIIIVVIIIIISSSGLADTKSLIITIISGAKVSRD